LTLAILITCWGLTVVLSGGYPRPVQGFGFITAPLVPRVPTPFLWSIPIVVAAVVVLLRTRLGTYFWAIGSNEEGTRLAGINVDRYKIIAFMLSGTFTGIGSIILFGHLGSSAPVEFNMNNVVRPLVAIILGGTPLAGGSGGPHRTILGVFTFSILYRGLHLSPLRPEVIDLVVGIVLILSIIISSKGMRMKGVDIT
jgi:ribose/xylose/arabinose/galactoside ABC-type transport system permease subunit